MTTKLSKFPSLYGESGTFIGLILLISLFFFWLDYRDVSHEEITNAECLDLNERWQNRYTEQFRISRKLSVNSFECPTVTSGLALGLRFLEQTSFSAEPDEAGIDFWTMLIALRPKLGLNSGLLFSGRASFDDNRIHINPVILTRGNPVEIAGILVHEARHLQQRFNTHVRCVRNPRLTCDERLAEDLKEGDAYSYSVLFYHFVLKRSDANAQDKRSAARLLDEVLNNRFNAVRPELMERYAF